MSASTKHSIALLLMLALLSPLATQGGTWRVDARRHRLLNREKNQLERQYKAHKQAEAEVNFVVTKLPHLVNGASNALPGAIRAQLLEIGRRFKNRDIARALRDAAKAIDGFPGYTKQEKASIDHLQRLIQQFGQLSKDLKQRHDAICKELNSIIPPATIRRFRQEARRMLAEKPEDRKLAKELEANEKRRMLETLGTSQSQAAARVLDERIHVKKQELQVVEFRKRCGKIMLEALADDVLDEAEQQALQDARKEWSIRNRALMQVQQNSAMSEVWRRAQGRPGDSILAGMRLPSVATQPVKLHPSSPITAPRGTTSYDVSVSKRGRDGAVLPLGR